MRSRNLILLIPLLLISKKALAICPICTIAVGSGLGILRAMGVDDSITGTWFGALIVSSILWSIDWMDRKNIDFRFKRTVMWVSFYILFIGPLYPMKAMSTTLLWGIIVGSVVFLLAVKSDRYLRKINDNKVVFFYQKVVIPVVYLIITNIVINLIVQII